MSIEDPEKFAESAGLVYVSDDTPGYTRKKWGRGFIYFDPDDKKVKNKKLLKRFKDLVIPPAWKNVWISADPNGHIQVTGFDQKERKQYIYHPEWLQLRNRKKYDRMYEFGLALPKIRKQVEEDLKLRGLPRRKVLAAVVNLLDEAMIRIGNKSYAKSNNSYGLTTLRKKHVEISGATINLAFKAKSGKDQSIKIKDRHLAKIIRKCNELPGYEIFKYIDEDGKKRLIESGDVNEYLREISGKYFTAKFFRTWGGSIKALEEYDKQLKSEEKLDKRKSMVTQVVKRVSANLNNTVSICRDYYIHPVVIDLIEEEKVTKFEDPAEADAYLDEIEKYFLKLIKRSRRNNKTKLNNVNSMK